MLVLLQIFLIFHPLGKWKQWRNHYNANIEYDQHSSSQQNFINSNQRKRFLFSVRNNEMRFYLNDVICYTYNMTSLRSRL